MCGYRWENEETYPERIYLIMMLGWALSSFEFTFDVGAKSSAVVMASHALKHPCGEYRMHETDFLAV